MPEESGGAPLPPGRAAVSSRPEPPLLPAGLPVLPRLRLAACRRAAAGSTQADGDWLDALVLPGGRTALVIGHAEGPGGRITAAASRLRSLLRDVLRGGAAPAEALARLNAAAGGSPDIRRATACLAVLDPATGELRYACAGQPAPVICGADGELARPASELPDPGAGPPEPGTVVLPAGAVLLLYSGPPRLAEGDGPAAGVRRVADAAAPLVAEAAAAADLADRVGPAVLARLGGRGPATVLAAHRLSAPAEGWSMDLPADPLALRGLRARLRDWLQELGAAVSDRTDVELAVWEAGVNAIVHGRPPAGTATVTVRADLDDDGRAVIRVSDRGRWQPPGSADPGRAWPGGQGLSVIRQATDELDIAPGPAGTTVTMRRRLSRPVLGQAHPGEYPATAAHHGRSG